MPRPALSSSALLAPALVVAGIVLGLAVQSQYWSAGPFFDDFDHRALLHSVDVGHRTLASYVWQTHNEHWLPLWKLWYYANLRAAEDVPWVWHVSLTAVHIGSGLCLYVILARYLRDRRIAAVGALVWLACAIGEHDNPLLWIGASHLSFAVFFVLLAMVCVTQIDSRASLAWLVAMTLAMAAAVGTMGAIWILLAAVPAQILLLEYRRPGDRLPSSRPAWIPRAWLSVASLVFVVLGAVTIPLALHTSSGNDLPLDGESIVQAFGRSAGGLAMALSRMLVGFRLVPSALRLGLEFAAAAAVVALLTYTMRANLRLLAVVAVLCLPYLAVGHLARASFPAGAVLEWGRYGYLPTLFWCLVIAIVLDALFAQLATTGRYVFTIAVAAALTVFLIAQLSLARESATRFARAEAITTRNIRDCRAAVTQLADYARAMGRPVKLIEFPIAPPFLPYVDTMLHALRQEAHGQVVLVDAADYTADDFAHAQAALRDPRHADLFGDWGTRLNNSYEMAVLLRHLSDAGVERGRPFALPNFRISYSPDTQLSVEEFAVLALGAGLPGVTLLFDRDLTPSETTDLIQELAKLPTQAAQDLQDSLEQRGTTPAE